MDPLKEFQTLTGWIRPSEAQALDFIAAAVRARQVKNGDPVPIFVATVRQRLWHHITNDQEDDARRACASSRFRAVVRKATADRLRGKAVQEAGAAPGDAGAFAHIRKR